MITLTSSIDPAATVQLRNPRLGNAVNPILSATYKKAMDGTRYSYIKTPVRFRHRLSFEALPVAKTTALLNVVRQGLKQHVTYVDDSGQPWKVHLSNPDQLIISLGDCRESFDLEFVGVKI